MSKVIANKNLFLGTPVGDGAVVIFMSENIPKHPYSLEEARKYRGKAVAENPDGTKYLGIYSMTAAGARQVE